MLGWMDFIDVTEWYSLIFSKVKLILWGCLTKMDHLTDHISLSISRPVASRRNNFQSELWNYVAHGMEWLCVCVYLQLLVPSLRSHWKDLHVFFSTAPPWQRTKIASVSGCGSTWTPQWSRIQTSCRRDWAATRADSQCHQPSQPLRRECLGPCGFPYGGGTTDMSLHWVLMVVTDRSADKPRCR